MKDFYFYIVQVNVGLLVFYLLYRMLFVRDTFLEIRRLFLLTALALSFVYPVISLVSWTQTQHPIPAAVVNYTEFLAVAVTAVTPVETVEWSWQDIVWWIWAAGSLVLLVRMLVQFCQLCRMAYQGKKAWCRGQRVIVLPQDTVPFSFFGWIFINPADYEEKELAEIIAHENTHVSQWHSVDMLCGECLCILFWFNPVVWLFRKEIRQNLEFLADKKVVASGYNRKNYQYHLLRLSHQPTAVPIVNNFNVSSLKKRIIMMNKKRTSRIGLIKYALLVPVTGMLILSANAATVMDMAGNTWQNWNTGLPQEVKQGAKALTGKVVDENGKPLTGASVFLKGTGIGTLVDEKGNFRLEVPGPGTLCFSYVGKKTITQPFGMETGKLQIRMENDNLQLDKIVVAGYSETKEPEQKGEIFVVVEDMPSFPGGSVPNYIAKNIKYPVIAMENGVEGTVYVSFVIDQQGKVTDAEVVKSVDARLDKEALRVINGMPDWKPGKQRGKPVAVQFTVPIEFMLQKKAAPSEVLTGDGTFLQDARAKFPQNGMYIVDGKEQSADYVKKLSPDQVKTITILKDKSAVALYGEKGKNGVMVITTKE